MTTLDYYNSNARRFVDGSVNADMTDHYDRFIHFLPEKASILDLGCGSGRDTAYFRKLGYEVTPVDGSAEICKLAEDYLRTEVRCVSFEDLDYSEQFDAIWACASLLHVRRASMPSVMDKVYRALKGSGILYASFKYGTDEVERDGRYFNNYSDSTVRQLFPELLWTIEKIWVSTDVRPGRQSEQWVNAIARKQ